MSKHFRNEIFILLGISTLCLIQNVSWANDGIGSLPSPFNNLNGAVHVIKSKLTKLTQRDAQWIEEQGEEEQIVTFDKQKLHLSIQNVPLSVKERPPLEWQCVNRNSEGMVIEYFDCDEKKTPRGLRILYTYSDDGRLLEERHYESGKSMPTVRKSYVYDPKLVLTEINTYEGESHLSTTTTITRELSGASRKVSRSTASGEPMGSEIIAEDGQGRDSEVRSYDEKGVLIGLLKYTYDAKGEKSEERFVMPDGTFDSLKRYVYVYDWMGNWIEKQQYILRKGREERSVIRRTITYYSN